MLSHILEALHYNERLSLLNKSNWVLGSGFNSRLVENTEIPLLVIACFDNNGFLGMVTLKSFGGVFAMLVFPIVKQIIVSI